MLYIEVLNKDEEEKVFVSEHVILRFHSIFCELRSYEHFSTCIVSKKVLVHQFH